MGDAPRLTKPVVLVGLMGAGKTTIGRKLAQILDVPFVDSDQEMEAAAGLTVREIFERHGEAAFRAGERRVIERLLGLPPQIIATGGGAFMNPQTRARIKERAISVWLRAELPVLMKRVLKRPTRPLLLSGDPEATMRRLMAERYPVYAEADLTVDSPDGAHEDVVAAILDKLKTWQTTHP